jgi:lysophospholipase L1-like esterase
VRTLLCAMALAAAAAETTEAAAPMLPRTQELIATKQPVRVVIYGDSISELKKGWSGAATTPEANWGAVLVKRLSEAYPGSSFSGQHFAIGGQNSYEGLGRIDGLEPFKPDLVLVAFGANDCCFHYLLPEETQLALSTLATEIRKRFGADVVLVSTGGDNPLKPFFKHLDETVAAQRQAAADTGVPFVDMRKAMLAATENGKRWGEFHWGDANCHPIDPGHIVWAETALKTLQETLTQQEEKKNETN